MNSKSITFRGSGSTGKESSQKYQYIDMLDNKNAFPNEIHDVAIVGCGPGKDT